MAAKSSSLLFVILSVMVVSSLSGAEAIVGNYRPIENLKDPEVVEIANFAVTEHNRKAKTTLEFDTIVSGEKAVVAGYKYKLIISAKDGGAAQPGNYTAVVWTKPWMQFTELVYFVKNNYKA